MDVKVEKKPVEAEFVNETEDKVEVVVKENKAKKFLKDHKKAIIGGALALLLGGAALILGRKGDDEDDTPLLGEPEDDISEED